MSERGTSAGARVLKVAAGVEHTDQQVPVRDVRHERRLECVDGSHPAQARLTGTPALAGRVAAMDEGGPTAGRLYC